MSWMLSCRRLGGNSLPPRMLEFMCTAVGTVRNVAIASIPMLSSNIRSTYVLFRNCVHVCIIPTFYMLGGRIADGTFGCWGACPCANKGGFAAATAQCAMRISGRRTLGRLCCASVWTCTRERASEMTIERTSAAWLYTDGDTTTRPRHPYGGSNTHEYTRPSHPYSPNVCVFSFNSCSWTLCACVWIGTRRKTLYAGGWMREWAHANATVFTMAGRRRRCMSNGDAVSEYSESWNRHQRFQRALCAICWSYVIWCTMQVLGG